VGLGEVAAGTTTSAEGTTTTTDGSETSTARAVVEVNGDSENVVPGDDFPATNPAFRLIAVNGQTAEIGLVTGTFSTGSETITVDVGESFILVSETDGSRYVLKLLSVST
jgi:hypothetical protein